MVAKQVVAIVIAVLVGSPSFGGELEAVESLRSQLNQSRALAGVGLISVGLAAAVFGAFQWRDAEPSPDVPAEAGGAPHTDTGRYAALVFGGVVSSLLGVKLLFPVEPGGDR